MSDYCIQGWIVPRPLLFNINIRTSMRQKLQPHQNLQNLSGKKEGKICHLPEKEAESIPWDRLLVDIIIPFNIRIEEQYDPLIIKYSTMIDPMTGWFEIVQYNYSHADNIDILLEKALILLYPKPTIVMNS